MKYSIIYAVLRPEISEQISVGMIYVDGETIDVKYSKQKISALKGLFSENQQKFLSKVVSSIKRNGTIKNIKDINYLTRYSNNLLTVSPLQSVDLKPTDKNKDLLYRNYVYNSTRN